MQVAACQCIKAAGFQVEVPVCCFPTAGEVKKVGDETSPVLPAWSLDAEQQWLTADRLCVLLECCGAVRMTVSSL